ncbi:MAG: type II toxin-antitoxin system RelE/ParE family toxin [Gammaproteobacteria bacterium]|nr:type II toxin-antitoxin system RelE/ParE family toxin [Gammaproteobacteria bacterium]
MEVLHFEDESGHSPFQAWFDDLDPNAAAKVTIALTRLGLGNTSNVKSAGKGVSELTIDFGPGYRVYFGQDGADIVILLTGGTKKRQQRDINAAQAMWKQYKARKKGKA